MTRRAQDGSDTRTRLRENRLHEARERQSTIEKKLAGRHLAQGGLALYVVRSSVAKETLDADRTVRSYKLLSNVEQANPQQQRALDLIQSIKP